MSTAEAEITHAEELAALEREPRVEKVAEVERLFGVLTGAAAVYLTDYRGINVARMNDLRARFRAEGIQYRIVKNTLLKRAADTAGLEEWLAGLEGPVGMAVGLEDPVAPARVIEKFRVEFRREGDFLGFRGGLVEGHAIEEETFQRLAMLPDREDLLAQVLYLLTYPMRGLVTVLSGLPRSLVYALEDLRKRRLHDGGSSQTESSAAGSESTESTSGSISTENHE